MPAESSTSGQFGVHHEGCNGGFQLKSPRFTSLRDSPRVPPEYSGILRDTPGYSGILRDTYGSIDLLYRFKLLKYSRSTQYKFSELPGFRKSGWIGNLPCLAFSFTVLSVSPISL